MSDRKRVNISVDPETYERMKDAQRSCGFKNPCEMIVALLHVVLDRLEDNDRRVYDLPDEDGRFIDEMFDRFSFFEPTPASVSPSKVRRRRNEGG